MDKQHKIDSKDLQSDLALRLERWVWAAERSEDRVKALYASAIGWADLSLKTAITVNGGAAIALLALFGAVFDKPKGLELIEALSPVILKFGFGVACATGAAIFAYFADMSSYLNSQHPWDYYKILCGEKPNELKQRPSTTYRYIAICLCAVSLVSFIYGCMSSACGLTRFQYATMANVCTWLP